ncbi:MAG: radical SAM protein [Nitrososphaerota archaeon]
MARHVIGQDGLPTRCHLCMGGTTVSKALRVCVKCLRESPEEALKIAAEGHASSRRMFGLPPAPPRTSGGIPCTLCAAGCVIGEGELGYCGIRGNRGGRMYTLMKRGKALLHYYLDPHVTNCCNAYFCPAGTGAGYPRYACTRGPEIGYYNLALFFYGCGLNCLFCQSWTHKKVGEAPQVSVDELIDMTLSNEKISCWCWFGGSPEPQLPFAIEASRRIHEEKPLGRVLRICYEWNGDGNPFLVKRVVETVLESGGNVKFDLKAFNPNIHKALTGLDNKRILENFEMVYRSFYDKRPGLPVLAATTLLVPGYVDAEEVTDIAEFIASLDETIPYSLLVFYPHFMMDGLPVTPWRQVIECYRAATKHLKRVEIGNIHLLVI